MERLGEQAQEHLGADPVTPDMTGKDLEVVVLGGANAADHLRAEVWQTAPSPPFVEKRMVLE